MYKECVPFKRKALYLLLTIPIITLYIIIAVHLWSVNVFFFIIYSSFFVLAIIFQSYCCAYQDCPYIGRFCPGVGGFVIPASIIAILLKNIKKSKFLFELCALFGFTCLIGVIVFPVYFLYKLGIFFMIIYLSIVLIYSFLFLLLICPVCAIRNTCPAGKVSGKLRIFIKSNGA